MNRIEKIDAWLIGRHQDLIDRSQKSKGWWVEQCAAAVMVGDAARAVIRWSDPKLPAWFLCVQMVASLLLVAWLVAASRVPAYMAFIADAQTLRRFCLVMSAVASVPQVLVPSATTLPWILGTLGSTCCFYFAACQPPKPREPRRKLATSRIGS